MKGKSLTRKYQELCMRFKAFLDKGSLQDRDDLFSLGSCQLPLLQQPQSQLQSPLQSPLQPRPPPSQSLPQSLPQSPPQLSPQSPCQPPPQSSSQSPPQSSSQSPPQPPPRRRRPRQQWQRQPPLPATHFDESQYLRNEF